jgi:hypothetical protein
MPARSTDPLSADGVIPRCYCGRAVEKGMFGGLQHQDQDVSRQDCPEAVLDEDHLRDLLLEALDEGDIAAVDDVRALLADLKVEVTL